MANRRMFSKSITNSSGFLMMPQSSQNLYFHLGMNADDNGFVEHFTIMRMTDSKPDDLKVLQAKGYVQVFDDKVLVIKDWKENNLIRIDRYSPSRYLEIYKQELQDLSIDCVPSGIPTVNQRLPQVRLGKVRLGKDSKEIYIGELIDLFNSLLGTNYKGDSKTERQFKARIKEGYTLEQFKVAITNASKDSFLMGRDAKNKKRYLTPEYITRADKLEQWLNSIPAKNFANESDEKYFND